MHFSKYPNKNIQIIKNVANKFEICILYFPKLNNIMCVFNERFFVEPEIAAEVYNIGVGENIPRFDIVSNLLNFS